MASLATSPPLSPLSTPSSSQPNEIQSTSGTAVRTHGMHFIRRSWQNISKASKFMLVSSVFFIVSQIIVSSAILAIYRFDTCDKPLDTYLTVHVIRVGLLLPFVVHQYLTRPLFAQQQQQQQQQEEHRSTNIQQTAPSAPALPLSSSSRDQPSLPQHSFRSGIPLPPSSLSVPHQSNNLGTIKEWCERLKSLLDLLGILWFIVGNYLIFTSETCAYEAPGYYYTILTWVLLNYLVILVPIILCASVIFCLPGVLVVLRLFNVAEVPGMTMGASQDEILKAPIFKYESQQDNESDPASPIPASTTNPNINNTPRKSLFTTIKLSARRLFLRSKNKKNDVETKSYPSITMTCLDDALCSICLSEYEIGDLICKLWCNHHFHKDCVHEWLGLNSLCPLCKQNFLGKEHPDNNDHSIESTTTTPYTNHLTT